MSKKNNTVLDILYVAMPSPFIWNRGLSSDQILYLREHLKSELLDLNQKADKHNLAMLLKALGLSNSLIDRFEVGYSENSYKIINYPRFQAAKQKDLFRSILITFIILKLFLQQNSNVAVDEKAHKIFLKPWQEVSADLTAESNPSNYINDLLFPLFEQLYLGVIPPLKTNSLSDFFCKESHVAKFPTKNCAKINIKTLIETHGLNVVSSILLFLEKFSMLKNHVNPFVNLSARSEVDYRLEITGEWPVHLNDVNLQFEEIIASDIYEVYTDVKGWKIQFLIEPSNSFTEIQTIIIKSNGKKVERVDISIYYNEILSDVISCYAIIKNNKFEAVLNNNAALAYVNETEKKIKNIVNFISGEKAVNLEFLIDSDELKNFELLYLEYLNQYPKKFIIDVNQLGNYGIFRKENSFIFNLEQIPQGVIKDKFLERDYKIIELCILLREELEKKEENLVDEIDETNDDLDECEKVASLQVVRGECEKIKESWEKYFAENGKSPDTELFYELLYEQCGTKSKKELIQIVKNSGNEKFTSKFVRKSKKNSDRELKNTTEQNIMGKILEMAVEFAEKNKLNFYKEKRGKK